MYVCMYACMYVSLFLFLTFYFIVYFLLSILCITILLSWLLWWRNVPVCGTNKGNSDSEISSLIVFNLPQQTKQTLCFHDWKKNKQFIQFYFVYMWWTLPPFLASNSVRAACSFTYWKKYIFLSLYYDQIYSLKQALCSFAERNSNAKL